MVEAADADTLFWQGVRKKGARHSVAAARDGLPIAEVKPAGPRLPLETNMLRLSEVYKFVSEVNHPPVNSKLLQQLDRDFRTFSDAVNRIGGEEQNFSGERRVSVRQQCYDLIKLIRARLATMPSKSTRHISDILDGGISHKQALSDFQRALRPNRAQRF